MSTLYERSLEALVTQLELKIELLTEDREASEAAQPHTVTVELNHRPASEAAAYHAGIDALAHQLGTHIDADIIKAVHDTSPYGADHRKKHIDLTERVKQLEGELRHHRGEVPPMLSVAVPPADLAAASLPFEATPHITEPAPPPALRLNEIQKREFLIAHGWTVHPEIEDQNIRVCWENGAKWQTLEMAYEIVVTEAKKAALHAAGWESVVDAVDEIERWKDPLTGELQLFHIASWRLENVDERQS